MEFIIKDYKGRIYKVHCVEDYEGHYENGTYGLWCMVYRALGIGANPYDFGEMEYEEDYSADFVIHPNECDCSDDIAVKEWLNEKFNNESWMNTWVELYSDRVNNKNNNIAKVLADYRSLDLERMAVADALEALAEVTEKMAEILENKFA